MKTSQKKYECQICGEVFTYYANKIKHERQCAGKGAEQSKFRKCPRCFVQYANESSLKRHLWNCTPRHDKAASTQEDCKDFDELDCGNNYTKKSKFCFFDNCYCTFNHISQLVKHIYSNHEDTHKYGIQMLEFSNMGEFKRWKKLESMRTHSSFIVGTNTKKFVSYVCQHDGRRKKWSKGALKKGKMCMSRILVIKNDDNVICTYMNIHTHDSKLEFQCFDKEFYNKIKSYICLGVDVNEIYHELVVKNNDETEMLYFREHFRYAKKNISRITRELRFRQQRGEVTVDESDDELTETEREGERQGTEEDEFKTGTVKRMRMCELKKESDGNEVCETKTDTSVLSSVGLTTAKAQPLEKSEPKRVVLLKRLSNNGIKVLPISKLRVLDGNLNIETNKLSPIKTDETPSKFNTSDTNLKEDEQVEDVQSEQWMVIKMENQFTPLNIIKERKASAIKAQIAIIDKHIDDTYMESDLDYIMKLVHILSKKCKSTSSINDLLNDETQVLKDSSSVILKYLKYTNDLQENVLFLNNNKIIISMVDLLTLVSPASSKPITYLCKRADPTFQEGRLTETIIDAFCYRLSQMHENEMYIFGNTNLACRLLNTEDGEQFFVHIDYKNKTHLFLPVHCNGVWTLIVFNLEHGLYGYLNSVKVNNMEHERNIKKIIDRLKVILPNENWKQMTFLSVYPKNAERSGVFICFYLECLTKKLPLMTPMKVHRFRLSVFNVIRGNCLREPKFESAICVVCKLLIIPLSLRVRCKECLVSYHYSCIKSGNLDEFVCNDLKVV